MALSENLLRRLVSAWGSRSPSTRKRRNHQVVPTLDGLEERVVLSHVAIHHALHGHHSSAIATTSGTPTTGTTTTTTGSTSAVATARQTLRNDVHTIELASGTTVSQLTAIRVAFQTLATDSLTPTSHSALSTFEDGLVKSFASGTTLTGNATLLAQFEALYTSTPTAQQTTDLTTAYNTIAAAVTSSNITSAQLATIDADQTALLTAQGSTSTATYPYFTLVTGQASGVGAGCHH